MRRSILTVVLAGLLVAITSVSTAMNTPSGAFIVESQERQEAATPSASALAKAEVTILAKEGKPGQVGQRGRRGRAGKPGQPGQPGRDGKDGLTAEKAVTLFVTRPEHGALVGQVTENSARIGRLESTFVPERGPTPAEKPEEDNKMVVGLIVAAVVIIAILAILAPIVLAGINAQANTAAAAALAAAAAQGRVDVIAAKAAAAAAVITAAARIPGGEALGVTVAGTGDVALNVRPAAPVGAQPAPAPAPTPAGMIMVPVQVTSTPIVLVPQAPANP
jgi:hypothetical protein